MPKTETIDVKHLSMPVLVNALELALRKAKNEKNDKPVSHRRQVKKDIEDCLFEIAGLCKFTPAESSRFLTAIRMALFECDKMSLDRTDKGLEEDIIPRIAEVLTELAMRRYREKD